MSDQVGSVARVRAALLAAGHPDTITEFPAGTRTAAEAAAAVGCTVAQIAKSIVFRAEGRAAVIITSGANRVDAAKASAALGLKLARADADWVRATTGFAIGGVAPIGHITPPLLLLDADLAVLDPDLGRCRVAQPRLPDHARGVASAHRRARRGHQAGVAGPA